MSDANPQAPKANTRKKRGILLIVVPLLSVLAIGAVYLHGGRYMETDNAYVKADKVPVSAQVAGNVDSLYVVENQRVEKGKVLFRLDDAMFKVMVDKASAKLAQVKTDLAVLKASYHEKQAEITLAETKLAFAEKEQKRQENLIGKHFVSESQLEDARDRKSVV